jgi:hypothetical protein
MITDDEYNSLIKGNYQKIFSNIKDLLKDETLDDYSLFLKKFEAFHISLQEKYFNYLMLEFFNVDNDFEFYLKLKNNLTLLNHLNQINDFFSDILFPYITSSFNGIEDFLMLYREKYLYFINEKESNMKSLMSSLKVPQYYTLIELINFFHNNFKNNDEFFKIISKNNIFININNKTYLSEFFINNLSLIFNINYNNLENQNLVLYDEMFLKKFYLITSKTHE